MKISNFTTTGALNGYDFYGWNEVTNQWINYKDGSFIPWNGGNDNFSVGRGYMVSYQLPQTKTFTGNINVGNVTMTNLSKTIGGANYSWHLLGNPFSSAIKWNDGNWALTNVAGTAKIWNGTEKSYNDIAPNGIIPSAQGFMVSVDLSNNSITIPAASRTHNNNNWLKSKEEPGFLLLASEQDGNSVQENKILINPASTIGFDFEYDSRFLPGYAPQFYSISDNEMLSTNSLPSLLNDEVIPFGFVKNQADGYKIELKASIEGQVVYLTDLKTNAIQNLSENPVYNFTSADGDDPARFNLRFSSFTSIPETQRSATFEIYQKNGLITILTNQSVDAQIVISNMLGQVVMSGKTNGNQSSTLNTSKLQNGVYVISLTGNNMMKSKKIVISK